MFLNSVLDCNLDFYANMYGNSWPDRSGAWTSFVTISLTIEPSLGFTVRVLIETKQ